MCGVLKWPMKENWGGGGGKEIKRNPPFLGSMMPRLLPGISPEIYKRKFLARGGGGGGPGRGGGKIKEKREDGGIWRQGNLKDQDVVDRMKGRSRGASKMCKNEGRERIYSGHIIYVERRGNEDGREKKKLSRKEYIESGWKVE
jgi:hypothetical protein